MGDKKKHHDGSEGKDDQESAGLANRDGLCWHSGDEYMGVKMRRGIKVTSSHPKHLYI